VRQRREIIHIEPHPALAATPISRGFGLQGDCRGYVKTGLIRFSPSSFALLTAFETGYEIIWSAG
jgi:hypothetical protein